MISFIKKIFGSHQKSDGELWVMVQENEFFRSDNNLLLVEKVAEIVESKGLGELDGHSSGAYQLEFNFYDVRNYEKTKLLVQNFLVQNYPDIEFHISKEYETTYEKI